MVLRACWETKRQSKDGVVVVLVVDEQHRCKANIHLMQYDPRDV